MLTTDSDARGYAGVAVVGRDWGFEKGEAGVADSFTNAVPRLAGDRSAKRIRGSVADSLAPRTRRTTCSPARLISP
ncbi:MAG: hypothetical protein RLZZ461_1770 [Planctomycetota bacterium]|jgi:hypothetical protein